MSSSWFLTPWQSQSIPPSSSSSNKDSSGRHALLPSITSTPHTFNSSLASTTATAPSNHHQSLPSSKHPAPNNHILHSEEVDQILQTCRNEDEVVDRLLTQFPTYGTSSSALSRRRGQGTASEPSTSSEHHGDSNSDTYFPSYWPSFLQHKPAITAQNDNSSESALPWVPPSLIDEVDGDGEEPLSDRMAGPTLRGARGLGNNKAGTIAASSKSTEAVNPSDDWDAEEQRLWKPKVALRTKENTRSTLGKVPPRSLSSQGARVPLALHPTPDELPIIGPRKRALVEEPQDANLHHRLRSLPPQPHPQPLQSSSEQPRTDINRQHWMPDQLCKQCYSCELAFTMFRRRHHCRLCGQVFCNSCSAFFVPATSALPPANGGALLEGALPVASIVVSSPTLRVCKLCYDQVSLKGIANPVAVGTESDRVEKHDPQPESGPPVSSSSAWTSWSLGDGDADALPSIAEHVQSRQLSVIATESSNTDNVHASEATAPLTSTAAPPSAGSDTHSMTLLHRQGTQFTGHCAAEHLEQVARDLLRVHAPSLWQNALHGNSTSQETKWVDKLLSLATKCVSTVDPNVKKGDLIDIRPYVKIKVVPGGSLDDCAYMSGVMFRKTVSHKYMAKELSDPRIMLLSGGIEFTRRENRIASLETLFEQEEKYLEILVGKIIKYKPDVLLVGRSVSRKAQELLFKAGVVLVQYVKPALLNRISRQTGATVISSTDHVMSQFGSSVLGRCRRFRLVTFRDNEIWDGAETSSDESSENKRRSIPVLLTQSDLTNPERQAVLAANKLGDGALDGSEAVKMGLAGRGVARNFILLEGCPKNLGCTIVLRGSLRATLKELKVVFRFLVGIAYNLKLEVTYFRERGIRIQPEFKLDRKHSLSSSLCVDYGDPPVGKKVRPWNGGQSDGVRRSSSGDVTAFDHQAILVTSVWMTDKTQCCPAEVKGIVYYSLQDVALGQFLRDSCFNLSLRCQNPNCKKSVLDHSLSFVHNDGLLKITVEELDEEPIPHSQDRNGDDKTEAAQSEDGEGSEVDRPISTWTYCNHCRKIVSPLTYISDTTWKYSFGKFLEVFFYNRDAIINSPESECKCQVQSSTSLHFGCGRLAARFSYEPVRPFGVYVRRSLPMEPAFQKAEALRRLDLLSEESSRLFVKFDKHLERVTREARSLFNSPVNRPEHLQTVLSELNRIGTDVDNAAKTLHEKIASAVDSCRQQSEALAMNQSLFQFPWSTRRFVFMLTSSWNERLGATAQAIAAMKKLALSSRSEIAIGQNVAIGSGDPLSDSLAESMKRLRKLHEQYERYNISDITQVLPALPGISHLEQDGEYDDEFDDPDTSIDFADGVDADVLASRRRLMSKSNSTQSNTSTPSRARPTKSLGTRRNDVDRASQDSTTVEVSLPKTSAGGAVKSAITRFFNRGGRDSDPNTVDLGIFAEGRPRLAPGVNGLVVPICDDQLSTIIAYSLASVEYSRQFKYYNRQDIANATEGDLPGGPDQSIAGKSSDNVESTGHPDKRRMPPDQFPPSPNGIASPTSSARISDDELKDVERRMLFRSKSHIKHTYRDFDDKGQVTCKFVCTTYWATQFHAVRQVFLSASTGSTVEPSNGSNESSEVEQAYVESLSSASLWDASGGKSGASFSKSCDGRFVIKCISRTELQMFLDCAPAYFEYLSKAFFHGLPTVLCKIVGVYQIGVHNRVTGKRTMEQVAVMANIFYERKITRVFDLKGSLRGRFTAQHQGTASGGGKDEAAPPPMDTPSSYSTGTTVSPTRRKRIDGRDEAVNVELDETDSRGGKDTRNYDTKTPPQELGLKTLLDGDFLEFTQGRPMPMSDRAKAVFQMSILNDTLFLSIINVLDYSILVGVDEEQRELVVGIIDFMRQYDILKQMERVGKSLPMVVGSEAPTIIQPPLYKARFTNAMERYFMTVPCKWTSV